MGVSPMRVVGPEEAIPFSGRVGAVTTKSGFPFQSTRMGETPMPREEANVGLLY
jgi:hypothetical protein